MGDRLRIGSCHSGFVCSPSRGSAARCDARHGRRSDDDPGVRRQLPEVARHVPRHGTVLHGTGRTTRCGSSPRAAAGLRRDVPDDSQLAAPALATARGCLRCLRPSLRGMCARLRGLRTRPADAALRTHLPGLRTELPRHGEDAVVAAFRIRSRCPRRARPRAILVLPPQPAVPTSRGPERIASSVSQTKPRTAAGLAWLTSATQIWCRTAA